MANMSSIPNKGPDQPVDFAQQTLAPVQTDDDTKAQAWEAYHNSSSLADFESRISKLDLPDNIKADLWEGANMRFNAVANRPGMPAAAPMQPASFAPQPGTSFQATAAEQTPEGYAAAVQARQEEQPVITAAGQTASGFLKGAGQTLHTAGRVVNAATGDNIGALPTSFEEPQSLQTQGTAENVGASVEGLAEFLLGDEALKSLSMGDRLLKIQKVADAYEKASPAVRAAMTAGMNILRTSAVSGAQSALHNESPVTGAEYGAIGGALGEGLSAAAGKLFPKTMAAAEAAAKGKAAEEALKVQGAAATVGESASEALNNTAGSVLGDSRLALDYNDAAQQIKAKFNPVYDELRKQSGGVINEATGRYSAANGFDEAVNQINRAKKVIYSSSPASVDALKQAETELAEGQAKLEKLFASDPGKYAEAQAAWRKASTLEDLHGYIDKAFTEPSGVRSTNLSTPEINPSKLVAKANKAIDEIGQPKLVDALGQEGYNTLNAVRQEMTRVVNDRKYAQTVEQLTRGYLREAGASGPIHKAVASTGLSGLALGALAHVAGASNPVTAAVGLTASTVHYLYTHPDVAVPLLRMASKAAPMASQVVKQGVTHTYDPETDSLTPVQ